MYEELAQTLRMLCIDVVTHAKSGHLGMPLGMADVATVLFKDFLTFNPHDPTFQARDRFILSCGHGSALLYSLLFLTGYNNWTIKDLQQFRQIYSKTPGHPELDLLNGIETSTGPLGQGIGNAVGMAISAKKLASLHPELKHDIYVFGSDGDYMEGISHEALSLAGTLSLDNLILFYDDNNITIDGEMHLTCCDDKIKRFESYNFYTQSIDGHNYDAIFHAIENAKQSKKSSIILCKTIIGKSIKDYEGTCAIHGKIPPENIVHATFRQNQWTPFTIPENTLSSWRNVWARNEKHYLRLKELEITDFQSTIDSSIFDNRTKLNSTNHDDNPTKKAFQSYIDAFKNDFIIAGSADLSESNGTKANWMADFNKINFNGNYINYGIREHAMGAIANGINISGVFFAYTSTFLTFSDYMRPSIRMAAMMKIPSLFVFSHDSILIGEDGPTHQPIEHIDSLNFIPNLYVLRPCDNLETFACLNYIFENKKTCALLLTRQPVKQVAQELLYEEIEIQNGGYILNDYVTKKQNPKLLLVASGSEVSIAHQLKQELQHSYNIRIVSVPCTKLLQETSRKYKDSILELDKTTQTIIIEASTAHFISDLITHKNKIVINVTEFGKSASKEELANYFGFDLETIKNKIIKCFT